MEIRTPDIHIANVALYQLSYSPVQVLPWRGWVGETCCFNVPGFPYLFGQKKSPIFGASELCASGAKLSPTVVNSLHASRLKFYLGSSHRKMCRKYTMAHRVCQGLYDINSRQAPVLYWAHEWH